MSEATNAQTFTQEEFIKANQEVFQRVTNYSDTVVHARLRALYKESNRENILRGANLLAKTSLAAAAVSGGCIVLVLVSSQFPISSRVVIAGAVLLSGGACGVLVNQVAMEVASGRSTFTGDAEYTGASKKSLRKVTNIAYAKLYEQYGIDRRPAGFLQNVRARFLKPSII